MSTESALLAAVLAAPDDDTPRLVLADWWEDYGQADRAAFVRWQIEYDRRWRVPRLKQRHDQHITAGTSRTCRCHLCRLWHRWGDLIRGREEEWSGVDLARAKSASYPSVLYDPTLWYQRGFVEIVSCSAANWMRFGDALLARNPVRQVLLTTRQPTKIRTGPDGKPRFGFAGDPRRRTFHHDEIVAEENRRSDGGSLYRLRWPGVSIQLWEPSGFLSQPLGDVTRLSGGDTTPANHRPPPSGAVAPPSRSAHR